jgi:hypothetical protein
MRSGVSSHKSFARYFPVIKNLGKAVIVSGLLAASFTPIATFAGLVCSATLTCPIGGGKCYYTVTCTYQPD